MCTRFYFDNSIDELDHYWDKAVHSPIGKKFAVELSKPVMQGEIRPTDIVPVLARGNRHVGNSVRMIF